MNTFFPFIHTHCSRLVRHNTKSIWHEVKKKNKEKLDNLEAEATSLWYSCMIWKRYTVNDHDNVNSTTLCTKICKTRML